MIGSVFEFAPTLLLKAILEYIEDPQSTPTNAAWLYVILLFSCGAVQGVANGQGLWIGRRISVRIRAVIIGEIYSKALRRKAAACPDVDTAEEKEEDAADGFMKHLLRFGRKKKASSKAVNGMSKVSKIADPQASNGEIINLMSIDSFKVSEVCAYLHFLWAAVPVEVAMAMALLYNILGLSSLIGIALMFLLLPLNLYIAKSFLHAQKKIMACTDARIHSTNEILQNIRIIKYFAWEERFLDNINEKRREELKALRKRYILWSLAYTNWNAVPIVIAFFSFFAYTVVEKKPLFPSVAFPALSTIALLRTPMDQLAYMVARVQDAKVSVDRIEKFLNEEETEKYAQLRRSRNTGLDSNTRIALERATLTWASKSTSKLGEAASGNNASSDGKASAEVFRLIDINVEFQRGRLNIIAGPTGSGKTSLLMALLGEMELLEGCVSIPGGSSREDLRPDLDTGLTESMAYCKSSIHTQPPSRDRVHTTTDTYLTTTMLPPASIRT